ncbi:phage tail assembly protein [Actinomadura oligospora]|uniref:phage tail assembly protein n=1 Tax=Actinomadura oligospora TaxID=111804 RepID=UPI00047ABE20|nr:phage tail assembly protein [Actinomadura oligospora]
MLNFADLKAKAEALEKEKGLPFLAKDGKELLLRPLLHLSKTELKNALALVSVIEDDKASLEARLNAADQILAIAASRTRAMKDSLDDLPPEMGMEIFRTWMEAAQGPEASDSTS